jgi:hypothetical protein
MKFRLQFIFMPCVQSFSTIHQKSCIPSIQLLLHLSQKYPCRLECNSVVDPLHSMCKALGSIPSTTKKQISVWVIIMWRFHPSFREVEHNSPVLTCRPHRVIVFHRCSIESRKEGVILQWGNLTNPASSG